MSIEDKIRAFWYWSIKRKILAFFHIYPPYYKTLKQVRKQLLKENYYTGNGWTNLILELTNKLIELEKQIPLKERLKSRILNPYNKSYSMYNYITISQIKQKYGQLRYYVNAVNSRISEEVYKLINEAEKESWNICESCGAKATHTTKGWISRLCKECYKKSKGTWRL